MGAASCRDCDSGSIEHLRSDPGGHSLAGLFEELKRRKVFRVMAAYAVFAWIVLQVAEVTFEPLHLPDWALTAVVVFW